MIQSPLVVAVGEADPYWDDPVGDAAVFPGAARLVHWGLRILLGLSAAYSVWKV